MICPECNGKGETIYYVEIDRDENTVTVEKRKDICHTCNGSGEKPKTNADRIRAMSDEELAERLIFWNDDYGRWETDAGNFDGDPNDTKETAIKAELEWLKQPVEVDNG